jgi:hypothetical protein
VTYPSERWSHCNGWPTQMEKIWNGFIVLGDLPRKMIKRWSGLIVMGDLPRKKKDEKWFIVMSGLPRWKNKCEVVSL